MGLNVEIVFCNWWWLGWGSVLRDCQAVYMAIESLYVCLGVDVSVDIPEA